MGVPALLSIFVFAATGFADLSDSLPPELKHPAIGYFSGARSTNPVALLNDRLEAHQANLKFEGPQGYLRSVLDALAVPVESQMAVFSKTSLQADLIAPSNPRTIFFNDAVIIAWMKGGFIELVSQDPTQGVFFYRLDQRAVTNPRFERQDNCLRCHVSDQSLGVPGMIARSTVTMPDGAPRLIFGGATPDHRTPIEERWGGLYVTGSVGSSRHMGNAMLTADDPASMVTAATLNVATLEAKFDTRNYLSPYSDVAALLVFDHQMYMMNLITRVGWEARTSTYDLAHQRPNHSAPLAAAAKELVDYLLFADEAPLKDKIRGNSGFTEKFAALGLRDRKGRSLRDLDLTRRLMKYPCSYMIYSDAFDGLPGDAKDAIYQRMWQVLSGQEKDKKYARLTLADRRAVVEILRDTKKDLPPYFQAVAR